MVMWISKSRNKIRRRRAGVIRNAVIDLIKREGIKEFIDRDLKDFKPVDVSTITENNITKEQLATKTLMSIAEDKRVVDAVGRWWDFTKKLSNAVSKETYVSIHCSTYFALLPKGTRLEAKKIAESEWKIDSEGKTALDQQSFFKAVFELADVWC